MKLISFQHPYHGQGQLPLDEVAQAPIQPGPKNFQGWFLPLHGEEEMELQALNPLPAGASPGDVFAYGSEHV